MSEPVPTGGSNRRLAQSVADMARSLAVVLAVVGVILLVTWRPQPDPITEVDVDPFFALAAEQATFAPLRIPDGVDGFRATSARWEPTAESQGEPVWFVGYVTPQEGYLQISQSLQSDVDFIAEQTAGGRPDGSIAIDDVTWERYVTEDRRSLVRVDGVTTIVSGTESWDAIASAAGSLTTDP